MLTNIELGEYLRKIRENKKISLRKVEELTDIGYTHLSMIENGKRNVTPALLRNLANVYSVDYLDLYEKAGYIELVEADEWDKLNKNNYEKKYEKDGSISYVQKNTSSTALVFVYGTIPAGIPIECIEDIIDTEEISVDMLKGGKQYFRTTLERK